MSPIDTDVKTDLEGTFAVITVATATMPVASPLSTISLLVRATLPLSTVRDAVRIASVIAPMMCGCINIKGGARPTSTALIVGPPLPGSPFWLMTATGCVVMVRSISHVVAVTCPTACL